MVNTLFETLHQCLEPTLTAYCVQGEFFIGEKLEFNGVSENSRTTTDVHNYEISDIQSLHGSVGAGTFTADIIPEVETVIGIASRCSS